MNRSQTTNTNSDVSFSGANRVERGGITMPAVPVLQQKSEPVSEKDISNNPLPNTLKSFQLKAAIPNGIASSEIQPVQRKNDTGLPDNLKAGVENLSGFSMDDVKVHYNSDKPAQLKAFAYAQGTDIHIASRQEKHLPHEAWHVAQQKQGRVQATTQMKGNVAVNDDKMLETEADVMGNKAFQLVNYGIEDNSQLRVQPPVTNSHVQQITQLKERNKVVTGTTHVVNEAGGSLYKKNWWENEQEELHAGNRIVVETDDQLVSRRGPNQEQAMFNESDEHGAQQYLWYGLRKINDVPPRIGHSYVREDTFGAPEDEFQQVELWHGDETHTSNGSIRNWLRSFGLNPPARELYPFLAQSGEVYGTTKTDAVRLMNDLGLYWSSVKRVQFQAYYSNSKNPGPGHLLMYDCQEGIMYQFKGHIVSQNPNMKTLRDHVDDYMEKPSSIDEGVGKTPKSVDFFDATKEGVKTKAFSQKLELRKEDKETAEKNERARRVKDDEPLHTRVLSVEVMLSNREYEKLKLMFSLREVIGFYNFCQEASMIDPGATRCLSILEDVAAMRGRILKPGKAGDVLIEFVEWMEIQGHITDL
ncbi:eCIS core domain-containing protein [Mucilaginibacter sp.]